jgi:DNA-directed RNA polymerase subunit RPC12/RpoP
MFESILFNQEKINCPVCFSLQNSNNKICIECGNKIPEQMKANNDNKKVK